MSGSQEQKRRKDNKIVKKGREFDSVIMYNYIAAERLIFSLIEYAENVENIVEKGKRTKLKKIYGGGYFLEVKVKSLTESERGSAYLHNPP